MPNFVGIPAFANSPGLSSLALKDPSGNAAVAVWAANMDWTIQLCAHGNAFAPIPSNRFQSASYKKDANQNVYFMLRGLQGGDNIAAYDNTGAPQTAALPITSVSTDRPSNNLAPRASAFSPKLILNPAGAEQSDTPITGQEWVDKCEKVIKYMMANAMGQLIVGALPARVDIFPFLSGEQNANSTVQFAPQNFSGGAVAPGAQPNEILFHELCHIADGTASAPSSVYSNITDPETGITFVYADSGGGFDFFTVNATNVYASMRNRPLRKDWSGFQNMPAKFQDSAKFWAVAQANLNIVKSRRPNLYGHVSALDAPWNPF
jgi:hypothetical protein